jgi:IMP dehydrogenase
MKTSLAQSIPTALTFDDVLLVPQYSQILPKETSLKTNITKNVTLNIPLVSAAMDTVTEDNMAITMALHGGIGVIHKNCSTEVQAAMVKQVKRFENGFIREPLVLSPENTIQDIINIRQQFGFKAVPITEDGTLGSKVVGLMTRNDYLTKHADQKVADRMENIEEIFTAQAPISLADARAKLEESKYSKLLVLNANGTLSSLVTRADLEKEEQYPNAAKDSKGRLRVAAACGPSKDKAVRIKALVEAGVDILVVDTAHGHSKGVIETVAYIKKTYGDTVDVIGGNIATPEAAKALIEAGADGVKVGIGPGSICTTRIIAGVGVPQLSAIMDTAAYANTQGIPVIADGGIRYSGDMAKALASGASVVMVGSLLAGTNEAPGELIYSEGKTYKYYRGMGSIAAMTKGSKDRYGQQNVADEKLVPEGIEGKILLKGPAAAEIYQMCGGLQSSLGYNGAEDLPALWKKAQFVRITNAGMRESHPHDVSILKESPNYRG